MSPTDRIPVYTSAAPPVPSSDELRATIPGWGVDLDPKDRPAYPQETRLVTGAHWDLPPSQGEDRPRERSIEHERLPPVFGTTVPLRGVSGVIRRYAYARFSEARAAHWLLLLAGDRVDAFENHVMALASRRPDLPLTPTILRDELRNRGGVSGLRTRADWKHQWLDPLVVAGPYVAGAGLVGLGVRALRRRRPWGSRKRTVA
ncbi:MAG: hypothetical protein HY829_01195 [Actinobacteria bacterium]|nr:hypothetical protein [Actinomycetota bacterium]